MLLTNITRMLHLKDADIRANAGMMKSLEAGKLIVTAIVATKNPEFSNIFVAGMDNDMPSGNGSVSAAAALMLGWTDESSDRIYRGRMNASMDVIGKLQLDQGSELPADFRLQCSDAIVPAFGAQSPRATKDGIVLKSGGSPIYRTFDVVTKDEFTGHTTLLADKV